jgi:ABC-type glutathione transport system ATPase component
VAIALALACQPDFLIADEPTSALDTATQGRVLDLLRGLQRERGLGLLLISHDAALVARYADAVVRMPGVAVSAPVRPAAVPVSAAAEAADSAPVLQVRDLRVAYPLSVGWRGAWRPAYREVLHGVSFRLAPGRTLALVGPSGSGKTTAAQAVVQLLAGRARVEGVVEIAGVALNAVRGAALRRARASVQMVFQDALAAFDPRLTLAESLAEGLQALRPEWSAAERLGRTRAMVVRVGLDEALLGRRPHALSGGQLQRCALARALVIAPQVLVCDEPTASLDGLAQAQLLALLRSLQRETGVALLCITHDPAVVAALADGVAVLEGGRIVACQPVAAFSRARAG